MSALSAYEKQRLENIKANREQLIALGIEKIVSPTTLPKKKANVKGAAANKKEKREIVPPRQKSLRQRNLDAEGKQMEEKPEVPLEPPPAPKRQRTIVQLDASKVTAGKTDEAAANKFFDSVGPMLSDVKLSEDVKTKKSSKKTTAVVKQDSAETLAETLGALEIKEDDMAKLVPERIFSVAFHPSASKLLVAAGDTWGKIGLWDCDNPGVDDEASPCVVTFEMHSRPVSGLCFTPQRPSALLSCSHDGSVRTLDLGGSGQSEVLHTNPADDDGDYAMCHNLSAADPSGCVYVACSDGSIVHIDPRNTSKSGGGGGSGGGTLIRDLHEKKIFMAQLCPSAPHLLATASLDRSVRVWDLRNMYGSNKKKPKPLCELEHGLAVTSARWSPVGASLLTTCNDDQLRVFTSSNSWGKAEVASAARHNNKTGRYITAFQAVWAPDSDDVFVCGSLEQPRGVDVYSARDGGAGGAQLMRMESEYQTAVTSLHAFHSSGKAMVGANASGRVYLWR
jgi:hypothetical protein